MAQPAAQARTRAGRVLRRDERRHDALLERVPGGRVPEEASDGDQEVVDERVDLGRLRLDEVRIPGHVGAAADVDPPADPAFKGAEAIGAEVDRRFRPHCVDDAGQGVVCRGARRVLPRRPVRLVR